MSKRQRQERDRRVDQENVLMKAHAQSMTEWARTVQTTVETTLSGLHTFLLTIVANQGIPAPEIPSIVIPPPPAFPTAASASLICSPGLLSTVGSVNGVENSDDAMHTEAEDNAGHRSGDDNAVQTVAERMFGGFFDAHGNDANGIGAGTFSPPGDDLGPF